jgi:murein DD-endopeptidase MepM/ murein hydrolase activator NlpD
LFAQSHGFAETSRAAGSHLIVDMGNSQYALYAHLKPYSVTLQVGDVVTKFGCQVKTGDNNQ